MITTAGYVWIIVFRKETAYVIYEVTTLHLNDFRITMKNQKFQKRPCSGQNEFFKF